MRFNRIIQYYVALWLVSVYLVYTEKKYIYLCIPFTVTLLLELIYIYTNKSIFPAKMITEIFYDLSAFATGKGGADENYSEGYYEGLTIKEIINLTPREGENRKFDKIIKLLGARAGNKILDLGCGTSTFGYYCKTKGIEVIGITLSSEQIKFAEKKGLKAYLRDYTKFMPEFENKFDHIIIMGSSEHITNGGNNFCMSSYEKKIDMIKKILIYCHKYLKQNGKIFYSGLHLNSEYRNSKFLFLLLRTYGGLLQLDKPKYDIKSCFDKKGFKNIFSRDSSYDYYLATILDKNHFGNTKSIYYSGMLKLLILSIFDPLLFYQYLYYVLGIWMWMWDGKIHLKTNHNYSFISDKQKRPVTLYWHVYQKI